MYKTQTELEKQKAERQTKIIEAIELYGKDVVYQAIQLVKMSDADGAYSHCEDMGFGNIADCIATIYF